MGNSIQIIEANLDEPTHARAIVELLDEYARDPMGDNQPLADFTKNHLVPALKKFGSGWIFLAYEDDTPVGIATTFPGFSTFAAKPLINLHDIAVSKEHRNKGIGRKLIDAVESKARELGCCKLTLEVRSDNVNAQALYSRTGFTGIAPAGANYLFWSKPLG